MPTLADDDPGKWVYQQHTRAKHEVLSYYFKVWTKIVSKPSQTIHVFDCFAGRGDYVSSNNVDPYDLQHIDSEADFPGSPLIMLDVLTDRNHLFDTANCYFLEPVNENRSALNETLGGVSQLPGNISFEVIDREFESDIPHIISEAGAWGDFGFFFIDPFGLKSLEYDTVTSVARTPGFDCIITLMTKELIRWQESDAHQDAFEALYGTPKWKSELRDFEPEHLETAEAEYYCSRLEEGGIRFPLAYMMTRGDTRELQYDLVLTTNHEKGLEAMKESLARCGTEYALAFAPERVDISAEEQARLTAGGVMTEEKKSKAYLLTRFAGESYEFGHLVQTVLLDPERRYARPVKRDYRQFIKDLNNEDTIDIPERDAADDPLPDHYTIQFPERGKD